MELNLLDNPITNSAVVSQNKIWTVFLHPVMFGVRVAVGKINSAGLSWDLCAGDNQKFLSELFLTVLRIVSKLPEDISVHDLEKLCPPYMVRPLYQDWSWMALQILASDLEAYGDYKKIPRYDFAIKSEGDERLLFFVAVNSKPIGKIAVDFKSTYWQIEHMAIDPEYCQKGIGTMFLQRTCQLLWEKNFMPIQAPMPDNSWTIDWYERMGFVGFIREAGDYKYGKYRQNLSGEDAE